MTPESFESVHVRLSDCSAGWIYFEICAGDTRMKVLLSHCFDPIPDFVSWLESIQTGVAWCGFAVDEEGQEKHFIARRRWHGRSLLTISESESGSPILRTVVHRRQLIETIYRGFQDFGKSPEYSSQEWGRKTLGEFLTRQTHTTPVGLSDFLNGLSDRDFERVSHAVLPSEAFEPPREIREFQTLEAILEFARDPGNAIVNGSLEKFATFREVEKAIPTGSPRHQEIAILLDAQVSPFDGTPLDSVRSEILESYLDSDRDRDV